MAKIQPIEKNALNDYKKKKMYNQQLFSIVASKYDIVTRLMSLNNDRRWKRYLVSRIPPCDYLKILDIASGTGDIAYHIHQRNPRSSIIASDLSLEMLSRGCQRVRMWSALCNDMCQLPVANSSVDIISGSYALRNAPDLKTLIHEMFRVLKPGGKAYLLDFSLYPGMVMRSVQLFVLYFWGCFLGILLHGNSSVYGYIAKSLEVFPDRNQIKNLFMNNGFVVTHEKMFFFNFIAVLEVEKKS